MPRRAAAQQRPVDADPVHRSKLVQQVINRVMLDGKKSTAERIVYDALAILSERTGRDPVEALRISLLLRQYRQSKENGGCIGGSAAQASTRARRRSQVSLREARPT